MEYYLTSKFTLVPNEFYNPIEAKDCFISLFNLPLDQEVFINNIDHLDAKLLSCKTNPFIYYLINYTLEIKDFNKILIHYSKTSNLLHVVIAKGNSLELVNTYISGSFKTALYYIFLALKQTITNPQQTVLRVFNILDNDEQNLLKTYFKEVENIIIADKIIEE